MTNKQRKEMEQLKRDTKLTNKAFNKGMLVGIVIALFSVAVSIYATDFLMNDSKLITETFKNLF